VPFQGAVVPLPAAVPVTLTAAERKALKKRVRGAWGLEGLKDLPRSGRLRRISAAERAAVVALACQLPAATGVPPWRWTGPELVTSRYNQIARPFNWKFTAADLTVLLRRISEREQQAAIEANLAIAADNPRRTHGATH
jgi:hypothetical protein